MVVFWFFGFMYELLLTFQLFRLSTFSHHAELYKMVCNRNETDLHINIPAVMLPQDAGASLEASIKSGVSGKCFGFLLFVVYNLEY